MTVWIPTGNVAQTEIDIQIEALKYEINNKKKLIQEYQQQAVFYRKIVKTLSNNISRLKKKRVKAVSLSEYSDIKTQLFSANCKLAEITEQITKAQIYIENATRGVEQLKQGWIKNATSILEFNHEKRRS